MQVYSIKKYNTTPVILLLNCVIVTVARGFFLASSKEATSLNAQCLFSLLYWTHNRHACNSIRRQAVFIKVCKAIMFTLCSTFLEFVELDTISDLLSPTEWLWLLFTLYPKHRLCTFFLLYCILISQSTIFKRCVTKLFLFFPLAASYEGFLKKIIIIILVMPLYKIQMKCWFDLSLSGEAVLEFQLDKSYCSSLNATVHALFPQQICCSLIPSPQLCSKAGNASLFSEGHDAPCHTVLGFYCGISLIICITREMKHTAKIMYV